MDKHELSEGIRMVLATCRSADERWTLLRKAAKLYRMFASHPERNPRLTVPSQTEPGGSTRHLNMPDERQRLRALARALVPGLTDEAFNQLCGAGGMSVEDWIARERKPGGVGE
jgi:hypothetical protein